MTRSANRSLVLALTLFIACSSESESPDGGGTCQAAVSCTPQTPDPCKTYATACASGVETCAAAGNQPDGTSCGTASACQVGVCTPIAGTATIGVVGGSVQAPDGAKVEIPPGALDGETVITISRLADAPPEGAISGIYELEPAGHVFAQPVKVTLPVAASATDGAVYWQRLDATEFDAIGGTLDAAAHTVTAETPHFSRAFVGPPSATRTVTGVAQETWISATSRTTVPVDTTPEALVPDGHGGVTALAATRGSSGTFVIPDVPAGEYILHSGALYVVTSSSTPDLGRARSGRPPSQLTPIDGGSTIDLTLTGLAPWPELGFPQYGLELFTTESGSWDFVSERFGTIDVGATSATLAIGLGVTNGTSRPPCLVEQSKGDRMFVAQLESATTSSGVSYSGIRKIAELPAFDAANGGSVNVTGAMQDFPQSDVLASIDWRGSQWAAALAQDGNPTHRCDLGLRCSGSFGVFALPGLADDGAYSANADLLLFTDAEAAGTDLVTGDMHLGSSAAFPGTWTTILAGGWQSSVIRRLPGTRGGATADLILWVASPGSLQGPLVPPITPATSIQVGTADFFAGGSGMSTTPTLSWNAPRRGSPSTYRIRVSRLVVDAQNRTTFVPVATIVTPHTSFTLPAGLLDAGQSYIFYLAAQAGTGPGAALLATAPNRQVKDFATATVVSGIFSP